MKEGKSPHLQIIARVFRPFGWKVQRVRSLSMSLIGHPILIYARVIKADLYRYYFTKLGSEESKRGQVWQRELLGSYWGVTNREGLLDAIRRAG